jgi:RHS repeat-associated protein
LKSTRCKQEIAIKRQATTTQFFYQNGKLATVNQGGQKRAIFRSADMPFAELSTGERQKTGLLEVDQNGSVLKVSGDADDEERHAYSAYGHDPSLPSQRTMAGFNGEYIEAVAAGYLLGSGYRSFSPALMRFISTDNLSPFDEGGINPYAYCGCDPINRVDPTGHNWFSSLLKGTGNLLGLRRKTPNTPNNFPASHGLTASNPSVNKPVLPEYSRDAPKGHITKEKAKDLLLVELKETKERAQRYHIAGNRQQLLNVGKKMKGKKVSVKAEQRRKRLLATENQLTRQAQQLRNAPTVSAPPRYSDSE